MNQPDPTHLNFLLREEANIIKARNQALEDLRCCNGLLVQQRERIREAHAGRPESYLERLTRLGVNTRGMREEDAHQFALGCLDGELYIRPARSPAG